MTITLNNLWNTHVLHHVRTKPAQDFHLLYQRTCIFHLSHLMDSGRMCILIQIYIWTIDKPWPLVMKSRLHVDVTPERLFKIGITMIKTCFIIPWRHRLCLVPPCLICISRSEAALNSTTDRRWCQRKVVSARPKVSAQRQSQEVGTEPVCLLPVVPISWSEFDRVLNSIARCAQMSGLLKRRWGNDGRRAPRKKRFMGENLEAAELGASSWLVDCRRKLVTISEQLLAQSSKNRLHVGS